jgi:hypothetical protein
MRPNAKQLRYLIALAAVVGALPVAAFEKTVCTITVNSADEKDAFRHCLPADKYRFVELVERGRPDWLASACRTGVRCDILVISGHYDGGNEFFSDEIESREFLPVAEMERVSCSDSCPGLFSQLKEVYLFKRYLPCDEYRFVELVERGRPDWLASACRQDIRCDALIISGHFDGGDQFYTDRLNAREFLPVGELKRASCSESCRGVFAELKEVTFSAATRSMAKRCATHRRKSRERSSARAIRPATPNASRASLPSGMPRAIATGCGRSSRMCRCSTAFGRGRRSDAAPGRCSSATSRRPREPKWRAAE